jgi:hypothetical protein
VSAVDPVTLGGLWPIILSQPLTWQDQGKIKFGIWLRAGTHMFRAPALIASRIRE